MQQTRLPAPIAAYIDATNAADLDAMVGAFSPDALVNDHRDEFDGADAIRGWAAREIIGDRVTMQVTDAARRGTAVSVKAIIDGNFAKTGLPIPLVLAFYFTVSNDRITQLVIVHNKPAALPERR